jgi:hypothetical protein
MLKTAVTISQNDVKHFNESQPGQLLLPNTDDYRQRFEVYAQIIQRKLYYLKQQELTVTEHLCYK